MQTSKDDHFARPGRQCVDGFTQETNVSLTVHALGEFTLCHRRQRVKILHPREGDHPIVPAKVQRHIPRRREQIRLRMANIPHRSGPQHACIGLLNQIIKVRQLGKMRPQECPQGRLMRMDLRVKPPGLVPAIRWDEVRGNRGGRRAHRWKQVARPVPEGIQRGSQIGQLLPGFTRALDRFIRLKRGLQSTLLTPSFNHTPSNPWQHRQASSRKARKPRKHRRKGRKIERAHST